MKKKVKSTPDFEKILNAARKRHAMALALNPLTPEQLTRQLASYRAICEVQMAEVVRLSSAGAQDDATLQAFLDMLKALGPDIHRGKKQIASAKKGHAAIHGTVEEKKSRAADMLKVCQRIAAEHPLWGITSVLDEAGEKLGCSTRRIRRNWPGIGELIRPSLGT